MYRTMLDLSQSEVGWRVSALGMRRDATGCNGLALVGVNEPGWRHAISRQAVQLVDLLSGQPMSLVLAEVPAGPVDRSVWAKAGSSNTWSR